MSFHFTSLPPTTPIFGRSNGKETRYDQIQIQEREFTQSQVYVQPTTMLIYYRTTMSYERLYLAGTRWALSTLQMVELTIDDGDGVRRPELLRYQVFLWNPIIIRVPRSRRG